MSRKVDDRGRLVAKCKGCNRFNVDCKHVGDGNYAPPVTCPIVDGIPVNFYFYFGKHRGNTVMNLCTVDPHYVIWAVANIEWFTLSEDAKTFFLWKNEQLKDKLYVAEVKHEEKFESNKTENNKIQE